MSPWASIQDAFARYARLYGLVSIALAVLRYVDRLQFSWDQVWQSFLPNFNILFVLFYRVLYYSPFDVLRTLLDIKVILSLVQLYLVGAIVFWLLTKFLPVVAARLLALKPAKAPAEGDRSQPSVKQSSPWTVVLTMTICLVASFHIIGRLIAHSFISSGNYQMARYFVFYPEMVALGLSALGILWAIIHSRGATSMLARKMDATILPDDHPLTQRVHRLAERMKLPPPTVGIMPVMNAYAMGTNRGDQAVVLGQPLLNMLSDEEVDAIIGHELGHIASNDMRRMMVAECYQAVIGGFFGLLMTIPVYAVAKNRSSANLAQTLYAVGRSAIAGVSELIVKRLSRQREYVADKTGAMLTSPEVMMSALEKVTGSRARYTAQENKYGYLMFRSAMQGSLLATHPTFQQRRDSLLNFADDLEAGEAAPHEEQQASPVMSAPALSLSLKMLAAVALVALGFSYVWSQTAINQAQLAREDREKSQAALQAAASTKAAGEASIAAKQRQFETDQENWKTRQNTAIRNEEQAAQRIREANAAADRARTEITRLEELRRAPPPSRPSYQVATAEPSAPPPPPPPQPVAPPPAPTVSAPAPAPSPFPPVQSTAPGYQTATVTLPSSIARPSIPAPSVTQCDQLAANPTDPQRTVADGGVSFPILVKNTGPAIAACEESSAANPNSATQKYQLARAIYAANRRDPRAERLFAELVDRSYAASFDNLGQIYRNRGDIQNAARVYRLGVNAGDPDSMISLGDLIREGKIAPRVENEGDYLYDLAASNGHKNAQKDVEERRARGLAIQTGITVLKGILGLR